VIRRTGLWRAAVAATGGLIFSLAAPPTDLYPAVLLGLGLLYAATRCAPRARAAAALALVWATAAGIVGMAFVPGVIARFTPVGFAGGVVALVLLSAFQGIAWACGAALSHVLIRRCALPGPLAFGAGVLLAISLPTVIAWSPAALMSPWPVLIQLAELIGERGVSFLLAVATALAASALGGALVVTGAPTRRARLACGAASAAIFAGLASYGAVRMPQVRARAAELPKLTVGIVQAAVPARLRWEPGARPEILRRLRSLSSESERQGAELTIWPEAAYPHVLSHQAGPTPQDERALLGLGVRGPLLVGLITQPADRQGQHNSATLVSSDGSMQRPQAKLELLWFGETVPLGQYLPFVRRIFSRAGGLLPGEEVALLRHAGARIGVLNCYEDTLPGIGRRIARHEPNLLVNVTNDAWFGPTSEPELHLRLSALRAVETRLDLVRAVNLGVPAWIDATGTIRARGFDDRQSVMVVTASLNDRPPTFYVTAGDIPVWALLSLAALAGFVRSRRRGVQPSADSGGSAGADNGSSAGTGAVGGAGAGAPDGGGARPGANSADCANDAECSADAPKCTQAGKCASESQKNASPRRLLLRSNRPSALGGAVEPRGASSLRAMNQEKKRAPRRTKRRAQCWRWRTGDGRPERDDSQGRTLIVRAGNLALDRFD
jgi:apolipoprotein N-acyltransferase